SKHTTQQHQTSFPTRRSSDLKRKMAAMQRRKLQPANVQSIHERRQICNRSRRQTEELGIRSRHNLAHRRPNQSADTQNENRSPQNFARWPQRRFVASSNDRCTADQLKSAVSLPQRSTRL